MGRENLFKEVKLPSLSEMMFLYWLKHGWRALQSEFAEKIASESQGNPLFVVESLRMLSEKGNLVQEDNEWVFQSMS